MEVGLGGGGGEQLIMSGGKNTDRCPNLTPLPAKESCLAVPIVSDSLMCSHRVMLVTCAFTHP